MYFIFYKYYIKKFLEKSNFKWFGAQFQSHVISMDCTNLITELFLRVFHCWDFLLSWWLLMLVYEPLDGMTGLEPATFWMAIRCSTNWATATYGISGARAGPALSSVTTPEIGADSPIRTDVDFRLVVTNHVQSATMRYRHMDPVMVIETTSTVWKTVILAVELHRVI